MMLWTALNSVGILLVGGALVLVIRQVGLMLQQMAPIGARGMGVGPRNGEDISNQLGSELSTGGRPMLILFGSKSCPVCSVVEEAARHVAPHWADRASVLMVYDVAKSPGQAGRNMTIASHATLRKKLDINSVPYGVIVDGSGIVVGSGLVNNASHVESLLELLGAPAIPPIAEPAEPSNLVSESKSR